MNQILKQSTPQEVKIYYIYVNMISFYYYIFSLFGLPYAYMHIYCIV